VLGHLNHPKGSLIFFYFFFKGFLLSLTSLLDNPPPFRVFFVLIALVSFLLLLFCQAGTSDEGILSRNRERLTSLTQVFLDHIVSSVKDTPNDLRKVFKVLNEELEVSLGTELAIVSVIRPIPQPPPPPKLSRISAIVEDVLTCWIPGAFLDCFVPVDWLRRSSR